MSRIDDALRRLSGGGSPEARTPPMLDRYGSEGPRGAEAHKPSREEQHGRVAAFEPPGALRHAEPRPPAAPAARAVAASVAPPVDHGADAPLIDFKQVFDYTGFVVRSLVRHKLLAAATVAVVLGLTVASLLVLPKTYHVETRLLAQRNAVMAALSNPNRAVPWDADAPTRAAAETVLRRDNLMALITQTDLIRDWDRQRPPALRLKDRVIATLTRHTPTPDERLEALIGLLEVRMKVDAGSAGDGTVTISIDWPTAEMGYRLVQAAQQAFVQARQVAETAAIGESISILERYSASLHQDIDRTLSELNRTQAHDRAAAAAPRSRLALARRAPANAIPTIAAALGVPQLADNLDADPDLKRMKASLESKRQELSRIEEGRERQLAELQARLAQLKAVYTTTHPTVLSVQQNIAALSQDPPHALALAAQIEELQADYDKKVGVATDQQIKRELTRKSAAAAAAAVGSGPAVVEPAPASLPGAIPSTLDSSSEFMALRLRSELNQLESVLERTDGARIELAVSQAAFKYRYTVIRPAQVPREPVSPNARMVLLAGLVASLFLALAIVASKDLLSNCILESWQVERRLGLPVLGTLRTA